jgi:hypothetical protein
MMDMQECRCHHVTHLLVELLVSAFFLQKHGCRGSVLSFLMCSLKGCPGLMVGIIFARSWVHMDIALSRHSLLMLSRI